MGKISKTLLTTLFVSSATAENFQVTGCNDETLSVSFNGHLNRDILNYRAWALHGIYQSEYVLIYVKYKLFDIISDIISNIDFFILASTTCFVIQNRPRIF